MNFDVIILGGGPAGIASAIILSKAGVSTALIEKSFYPRSKTCAGILTPKTINLLKEKFFFSKIEEYVSSNQVSIMYKRNTVNKFNLQFPFTFVERHIFDFELLNICRKAGTHIIEGTTMTNFFPNEKKLILSNTQSLTYKCFIVADGVFSSVRKHLGLANLPSAFCIQDTIERTLCPNPLQHLQEIQINFGDIKTGYSWIVPYQKYIAIGSGMFTNKVDYSTLLTKHEALCKQIGFPPIAKRQGAFVPIGGFNSQLEHPYENIVIIGDAAGLTNPLTGEGIYHALLSGFYAGQSYLLNSKEYRTTYLALLQPTLNQIAEQKALLQKFYNPTLLEEMFFQFKENPQYLSAICDNVISLENQSYLSLLIELQQLLR